MAAALYVTDEWLRFQNPVDSYRNMKKFAKSHSKPLKPLNKFVSDYALENAGDSEGFKNSRFQNGKCGSFDDAAGRRDLEAAASEGSCTPMRRKSSSAVISKEGFNIPSNVYSVSVMSSAERNELGRRLRVELERVRDVYQKIESGSFNVIAESSSSEQPSFRGSHPDHNHFLGRAHAIEEENFGPIKKGKDQEISKINKMYFASDFVSGNGKIHRQEKKPKTKSVSGPGGVGAVQFGSLGQSEPRNDRPAKTKLDATIARQCRTILRRLMLHKFGWVFNSPVDIVKLNIPDYPKVIKHPMDLGTIKGKLDKGEYLDARDFAADVRLTFNNAKTYNPPGNDVHIMADQLSKMFEEKWRSIERKLPERESNSFVTKATERGISSQMLHGHQSKFNDRPKQKNGKKHPVVAVDQILMSEPCAPRLTLEEKQMLSKQLESLPANMHGRVLDFLRQHSTDLDPNDDEVEVDIDVFDDQTLRELQDLVRSCLHEMNEEEQRSGFLAETLENQPANVAASNGSPLHTKKGCELGDEEIDIGENDLTASGYPSVNIEKETGCHSGKSSSSSSSSTGSGSGSSSDSDSASSSGSESDAANPLSPDAASKASNDQLGGAANMNQRTSPVRETQGGKRPISELDEENANLKHAEAGYTDANQEGDSAPSGRRVSPEKAYRAALMRKRFADTILKAQEKTFPQGGRGDPEKLKFEREQLERRQREEKARIQAEARAAELARKRAAAEAAAEAKRKLELEREAARLKLQQMEKSVEIYENTQVLKDLEMLRRNADHVPSSGDETSPVRNPLEELGLYMKMDEEEEEQQGVDIATEYTGENGDAAEATAENGDVEEGEI
eukprot:TRINITY_DN2928_c0_g1_i2.p1 TRINITY_DN2928_c0_g1~~TRINITY_DN2928_c0_g1_i2.p1  ORF type:complete len:846 (+),score=160.24 TRINITY_DN2928_c0_g1_i2:725-3262(+)